ncbi:MAG: formate-nitrite transporter family protein [Solirubrobacteraceae bacterium]|nr:formate-nitrite transporter family protein [Solirubrobacteraceae bacterium]
MAATETSENVAPEPDEIFARTREEGRRRLQRSRLELSSTALVAGFDVVFGVIALVTIAAALTPRFGEEAGHAAGALGFGIAFIFIVVGRSELFTENFLVPITGLRRGHITKLKLAELWVLSPVLNIVGGTLLILVVSVHGVLPHGSGETISKIAQGFDDNGVATAFCSAIVGGALITVMTWLVEGVGSIGGRIVCAWIGGVLLTLGSFNHVIVVTLEMIFGMRMGADVGGLDIFQNFLVAATGNMIGGIVFVTLTRTGQAVGASDDEGPVEEEPDDEQEPGED